VFLGNLLLVTMTRIEWLDSSAKKENPTIVIGKNVLLKILEDEEKRVLLSDPIINKFVSIPNLINNSIGMMVSNIIDQDEYLDTPNILRNLIDNKDTLEPSMKALEVFMKIFQPLMDSRFAKGYEEVIKIEEEKAIDMAKNKELMQDLAFRVKGQVDEEFIRTCEKNLLTISEQFEEKTGVKIIVPSNLFVCPKCSARLYDKEITGKKCLSCNSPISQSNIKRIPVYRVHEGIKSIWKSGFWFEAYLAGCLNKLGCKTWTGVYVMGASGILHEIDVVAIKDDGTLIVGECKTGQISRNDVFNFYTKIGDTKAHFSIFALIGSFPESQTRDFVKRNPAIIRLENMGNMDAPEVLSELKQGLRIKA
jgi:hypothetical protein